MGEGAVSPDRGLPLRAEIVHSSERTRVTRHFLSGRTVIRKEPLGPDAQGRLQHEVAILDQLRGVVGVAQLLDARYTGSMVLADAGGTSLAGLSKPLSVEDLIALALKLARAVAGMHGRGVIHRDISPANIVIADNATPCLVDFGLATSAAQIRPEFTHSTEIVGTIALLGMRRSVTPGMDATDFSTSAAAPSIDASSVPVTLITTCEVSPVRLSLMRSPRKVSVSLRTSGKARSVSRMMPCASSSLSE